MNPFSLDRFSISGKIGIYFLFNNNELVYIGQSTDIARRIQSHRNDKKFTDYSFIECNESELNSREKSLIQKYSPKLNISLKKTKSKVPSNLDTPEFHAFYNSLQVGRAKMYGNYFVANILGNMSYSFVKLKRIKGGYTKFIFSDFKGEITTRGSAVINSATGWFKYKGKTCYMEPKNGEWVIVISPV